MSISPPLEHYTPHGAMQFGCDGRCAAFNRSKEQSRQVTEMAQGPFEYAFFIRRSAHATVSLFSPFGAPLVQSINSYCTFAVHAGDRWWQLQAHTLHFACTVCPSWNRILSTSRKCICFQQGFWVADKFTSTAHRAPHLLNKADSAKKKLRRVLI